MVIPSIASDPSIMVQMLEIVDLRNMPTVKLALADNIIADKKADLPSMLLSTLLFMPGKCSTPSPSAYGKLYANKVSEHLSHQQIQCFGACKCIDACKAQQSLRWDGHCALHQLLNCVNTMIFHRKVVLTSLSNMAGCCS